MRLFIAIELPDHVRTHLVRVRDQIRPQVSRASFTRDQNLHITVKFLGNVEPNQLEKIIEALVHVRAGGAIQVFAREIECFPNRGPVRIIAAGFGGDIDGFAALHRSIEQRCQHLGFDRETREYRPHVTLARARPTLPGKIRQETVDAASSVFPGPTFAIRQFAIIESHLRPEGSEYRTIQVFRVANQG